MSNSSATASSFTLEPEPLHRYANPTMAHGHGAARVLRQNAMLDLTKLDLTEVIPHGARCQRTIGGKPDSRQHYLSVPPGCNRGLNPRLLLLRTTGRFGIESQALELIMCSSSLQPSSRVLLVWRCPDGDVVTSSGETSNKM
jgi:hypothetical protein